jgi:hypothetical protein
MMIYCWRKAVPERAPVVSHRDSLGSSSERGGRGGLCCPTKNTLSLAVGGSATRMHSAAPLEEEWKGEDRGNLIGAKAVIQQALS